MKEAKVFDFDGTLTTCDTFLLFVKYACGFKRFLAGMLLYSPLLVLMKLKLYPNWKAKQRVFSHFFAGLSDCKFDALCRGFADSNRQILRPKGISLVLQSLSAGEKVYIVSASIDRWVRPFFDRLVSEGGLMDTVSVIGTEIEVYNHVLTGRFSTKNCYGEEKVNRLSAVLKDRSSYHLTAYGDSNGDKEMLAYADIGHYKPFRD